MPNTACLGRLPRSSCSAQRNRLNAYNIGWRATTAPIYLSEDQVNWLRKQKIIVPWIGRDRALYGSAVWRSDPKDKVQGSICMNYRLEKVFKDGEYVWALFEGKRVGKDLQYSPVHGMVNPYSAWPRGHRKSVVTGDYDLFAIWPDISEFNPSEDRRLAGMNAETSNNDILAYEDAQLGNISNRVHLIAQLLNSVLGTVGGAYVNRNMIHHSDEGGRPFVGDVDLPLVAFVPFPTLGPKAFGINSPEHFRAFYKMCRSLGFVCYVNNGWRQTLGIGNTGPSQKGSRQQYTWANRNRV